MKNITIDNSIDWTHLNKFKGKWVALDEDERTVLGYSKNLKILYKRFPRGIMFHVPAQFIPYA